jgi:6-phosphogluconolactonase/glucosamine-6-phosphate isomerase/deaminase
MNAHVHQISEIASALLNFLSNNPRKELAMFIGGGSQLEQLSEVWSQLMQFTNLENIHVFLTDERYFTDLNHPELNFNKLMQDDHFRQLQAAGLNVYPILNGCSLEECALQYQSWMDNLLDEKTVVSLAILGLGADGHIAGILPHMPANRELFYTQDVVGYVSKGVALDPGAFPARVTLTFKGLARMHYVWVVATGEADRQAATRLMESPAIADKDLIASYPVLGLTSRPEITLFSDMEF